MPTFRPPPEPLDEDDESFFDDWEKSKSTTVASQISLASKTSNAFATLFSNLTIPETLLLIVCGVCILVLALSLAYFYTVKKMGLFSDNPWYRRRVYYATATASTHNQNPARCFNLYKRERPNTLSLIGGASTPPTVVVPVPTMDAAVGDDKIYEKEKKSKTKGAKSKLRSSESASKHHHRMPNSVGPAVEVGLAPPIVSRKSSSRRSRRHKKYYSRMNPVDDRAEISSDDSGAYVTPPQDWVRKEKHARSGGIGRKK